MERGRPNGCEKEVLMLGMIQDTDTSQSIIKQIIGLIKSGVLIIVVVKLYLTINKIWGRKHVKEVAEAQSVSATILGLVIGLPFLIDYVLDEKVTDSIRAFVGIFMGLFFFLVAIGFWVKGGKKVGFFRKILRAFKSEGSELTDMPKSFFRPKGADLILDILHELAAVDLKVSEEEQQLIQAFAETWGIENPLKNEPVHGSRSKGDLIHIRKEVKRYLNIQPPMDQASQLMEVIQALIKVDKEVTEEEELIVDELLGLIQDYVDGDEQPSVTFDVLLAPQNSEQEKAISTLLPDVKPIIRSGGNVFLAGSYYSGPYAQMVRDKYRLLHFLSLVEKVKREKTE